MTAYSKCISDRSIVPYPETPPDPGRAGSIIVDPFCGNRILRVTDAYSDPTKPNATFTTPSSSTANPWNADMTAFVLLDKDSTYYLYSFDRQALAATSRGRLARNFRNACFSASDPNLLWGYTGELKIEQLNIATGKSVVVVDLNDYPGLGIPAPPARWYLNGISVDAADQRFCAALGAGQDKSDLVVVYDAAKGVTWLNTQTGAFGGWREGSVPNWTAFHLHFTTLNHTGATVLLGPPISGDIRLWRVGTSLFRSYMASPTVPTYGHNAVGSSTFFGLAAGGPFMWIQAPLWNLELYERLLPDVVTGTASWWDDFHMMIQPDASDRHPILISTENVQKNPTVAGAPLTSNAPGDNELLAIAADGSGQWWRLAHHYSTGKDANFWSKPRGNVSPDGHFLMFTSDWEITLGGTYPAQRTDVFILDTGRMP